MAITGRQLGKSSIQDMMIRELTQAFSDSIDKDIVSVCNQYRCLALTEIIIPEQRGHR